MWRGAVPKELTDWAISIRDHVSSFSYGTIWSKEYDGRTIIARKDHHTFTYRGGRLLTGICIPGVTLYSPHGIGLVDSTSTGDPLATPDESMADALFDADSSAGQPGVDWPVVGATAGAALLVVGLFVAAIRFAGR